MVRSSLVNIFLEKSLQVASTHKSSTRQCNHIFNLLLLLSGLAWPVLLFYSSFLHKVCIWQGGTYLSQIWKEITAIGSPVCMWESEWEYNKFTHAIISLNKVEFQLQWPRGHKDHNLQDRRCGKERALEVRQVYIVRIHPAVVIYPKPVLLRQKSGFPSCLQVYKIQPTIIHTFVQ